LKIYNRKKQEANCQKPIAKKILLASHSPRRKELLQNLGFDFETVSIDCDEIFPENSDVSKVAEYLSNLKANAYKNLNADEIIIAADTIVVLENEILGKPKNKEAAEKMLRKLSGKTHQVYTGITIKTKEKTISQTDVAHVVFDKISNEEIEYYLRNFEPFDKAGSYGIQEWIGMAKIKKIEGNFYTIMGFPTHLVYEILKNL
jgi:septum formation protein